MINCIHTASCGKSDVTWPKVEFSFFRLGYHITTRYALTSHIFWALVETSTNESLRSCKPTLRIQNKRKTTKSITDFRTKVVVWMFSGCFCVFLQLSGRPTNMLKTNYNLVLCLQLGKIVGCFIVSLFD